MWFLSIDTLMENFKNFIGEGWFDWLKRKKPSDSWPGGIDKSNEPTVRAAKTPVDQANVKTSIQADPHHPNPNYAFHGFGSDEPRRKINQDVDKNQVTIYIKQLENISRSLANLHDFMVNKDDLLKNQMPQTQETFSNLMRNAVDSTNRTVAILYPLLHDEEID